MPAIKLGPGTNVTLRDIRISGFDVGVEGDVGASVDAERVHFDGVTLPWNFPDAGPSRVVGTRIKNYPEIASALKRGRRRSGAPLPAFCPKCKCVFPSHSYGFRTPRFLSKDNEETCKHCGFEHAKVSDGVFDLTAKTLRVIEAPDFTHVMLESLSALARQVVDEKIGPEEAVTRYEEISPALGGIARSALSIGLSALIYVSAAATIYSTWLQQQGLSVAEKQLMLQRESNASSDKALEQVLKALSDWKLTENQQKAPYQSSVNSLSESEAAAKMGSVKLTPQHKPKAREVRRKDSAARRRALNPRRFKP